MADPNLMLFGELCHPIGPRMNASLQLPTDGKIFFHKGVKALPKDTGPIRNVAKLRWRLINDNFNARVSGIRGNEMKHRCKFFVGVQHDHWERCNPDRRLCRFG